MSAPGRPPAELAGQLSDLGVRPGSVLMVHASMRRVGPVEGGADGLLDALRQALGPEGTLVMMIAADDDEPFDALSSPADPDNGILAEVLRRRAGVLVSDHAAARFAAWGPRAAALTRDPPLHDYYGEGSPLERICAASGAILRLGSDPDTVTMTHRAENLADLPGKRRVRRRYERADAGEQWIEGLDDSDGIATWAHGDYFPRILLDFLAEGHARVGPVGRCTAELLDAAGFVEFAVRWIETKLRS